MSARVYPLADLALAYELRQEYRMPWKAIARIIGCDAKCICSAVRHAVLFGVK